MQKQALSTEVVQPAFTLLAALAILPIVLLSAYWALSSTSTRIHESRARTAEEQRIAAREARRAAIQTAFDGILLPDQVDRKILFDALVFAGKAEPSTHEEITSLGHL